MGRPRGSQHLPIRAVLRTCRRVDELTPAGESPYKAMLQVGEETGRSRGAVEYRYKLGAEIMPQVEAMEAAWRAFPDVLRTMRAIASGEAFRGVRSFLSDRRR